MISFKQFLAEARAAPLYHATSALNAAAIVKSDKIRAGSRHRFGKQDLGKGVSFTRDYKYATFFGYHDANHNDVVVFEVDQQRLAMNNRIVPVNYWNTEDAIVQSLDTGRTRLQNSQYMLGASNNESEEFVIGDVKNFGRCIKRIIVTSALTMEKVQRYPELANHPLLWDKTDARYKGNWVNK